MDLVVVSVLMNAIAQELLSLVNTAILQRLAPKSAKTVVHVLQIQKQTLELTQLPADVQLVGVELVVPIYLRGRFRLLQAYRLFLLYCF